MILGSKIDIVSEGSYDVTMKSNEHHRDFHLLEGDNFIYAGNHIIFDFWGSDDMLNEELIIKSCVEGVEVAGATVLHNHFHTFGEGMGLTGVLVLSESHLSLHTWPEIGLMTFDIYMCGEANPLVALDHLRKKLNPKKITMTSLKRGAFTKY